MNRIYSISLEGPKGIPTLHANSAFIGLTYPRIVNVSARIFNENIYSTYVLQVHLDYIKFSDVFFVHGSPQFIEEEEIIVDEISRNEGDRLYAEIKTRIKKILD